MTVEEYEKIRDCMHHEAYPSANGGEIEVFCKRAVDIVKQGIPAYRCCPHCIGERCSLKNERR